MKNKIKLILTITIASILFSLFLLFGQRLIGRKGSNNISELLNDRYPQSYLLKTIKVDDKLVGCAYNNETDIRFYSREVPEEGPGGVFFVDYGNKKDVFEITVRGGRNDSLFGYSTNGLCQLMDINMDGRDEIITEWSSWNGHTGLKGLIIWEMNSEGELVPKTGYPESWGKDNYHISVVDVKSGEEKIYPICLYSDVAEIRPPGEDESKPASLRYAHMIIKDWPIEEGDMTTRMKPHHWKLSIYRYEGGQFITDKNWNNGEKHLTREEISVNEEFRDLKLGEVFLSLYN